MGSFIHVSESRRRQPVLERAGFFRGCERERVDEPHTAVVARRPFPEDSWRAELRRGGLIKRSMSGLGGARPSTLVAAPPHSVILSMNADWVSVSKGPPAIDEPTVSQPIPATPCSADGTSRGATPGAPARPPCKSASSRCSHARAFPGSRADRHRRSGDASQRNAAARAVSRSS